MRGSVVAVVTWLLSAMTSSAAGQEAMTSPSPKRVLPESHAKRLYDDKLEKSTYKKLIRPVDNTSESLTVRIGLRLTSIIDVVSPSSSLAAEPIGPDGPLPAHFLALVGRPYLWPAHFLGDVNFFFLYILPL